jgi:2-amino-4-hydroxy-6-hydroxymethyldihydropteridine diphosphokinase
MRVGIALGSNLGDRAAHLRSAAQAIAEIAEPPVLASGIYETPPIDCPPDSPAFLNAALEIGWNGTLLDLLARLQAIEHIHGRPGVRARNAPRPLDLDLIYADESTLKTPELELPHPRFRDRAFVLLPLADLLGDRSIPGGTRSARALLENVDSTQCLKTEFVLF